MLPDIDDLRCFEAAAQLPSFRAASRAVGLTPAALGQRIQKLESALEARLFTRTTRSLALTPAGLDLLPRARATLAAANECVRAARGEAGMGPVELTLGTRHELGLSYVLPALRTLESQNPGLRLNMYFGSGPDLFLRLRSREIDCAISSARLTDPLLDAVRVQREDYVFVGARRLLRRLPLRRPKDAARHTLIDIGAELPLFRYLLDAPGAGERFSFSRVRYMGTIGAIHRLVLDGYGVAVLPLYMVRRDLRQGRLRRIVRGVPPLFDWFRIVFRRDDPRRPLYERLAKHFAQRKLK
jgi:DNA-binding transcriptional LysR family regulator